ncbi:hypothetical protein CFIMG_001645RA [Ceratocystis fimbriata CBS 114723]|uniref:Uncharacterized protein n=1 Tax=Ceratocystis fimbriata CBS 114723 TaxID=1035309 RepID=A0A2C5XEG4_9PEZI|nr:hypothetical protein CFIMG_001645RA [Ceratocystis fimbriata CBS 114723]
MVLLGMLLSKTLVCIMAHSGALHIVSTITIPSSGTLEIIAPPWG